MNYLHGNVNHRKHFNVEITLSLLGYEKNDNAGFMSAIPFYELLFDILDYESVLFNLCMKIFHILFQQTQCSCNDSCISCAVLFIVHSRLVQWVLNI